MDLLSRNLRLTATSDGIVTEITRDWLVLGRVFGGHLAALCALAAADAVEHELLRSIHVVFPQRARTGPAHLHVDHLHQGKESSAVRASIVQQGRPVCAALGWLTRPRPFADDEIVVDPVPGPDRCEPLTWIRTSSPASAYDPPAFARHLDARAIDYPSSFEAFPDGQDFVDLWARLTPPEPESSAIFHQAFDLLLYDTVLLDPLVRRDGLDLVGVVSLDMSVHWRGPPPDGDWSRLRATVDGSGDFGSSSAYLATTGGTLRSRATSQCRVFPAARPG